VTIGAGALAAALAVAIAIARRSERNNELSVAIIDCQSGSPSRCRSFLPEPKGTGQGSNRLATASFCREYRLATLGRANLPMVFPVAFPGKIWRQIHSYNLLIYLATPAGIEPATFSLEGCCAFVCLYEGRSLLETWLKEDPSHAVTKCGVKGGSIDGVTNKISKNQ
jgi:hypothetical protein